MFSIFKVSVSATILVALAACASTPEPIPEPALTFQGNECSSNVDLGAAILVPEDKKSVKRMMRNRTLILSEMFTEESPCLRLASGNDSPYAVFELPTNITKPVVYAGSKIDSNSMFAAKIVTLDETGNIIRYFERDDYKKFGTQYGVQFRPKAEESYVLIKADADMIGDIEETSETRVDAQTVTMVYGAVASSGTNYVGKQSSFSRTYSYDGEVGIRVVFPKQEEQEEQK